MLKELGMQPEFLHSHRADNRLADCLCYLAKDLQFYFSTTYMDDGVQVGEKLYTQVEV
ncbi:hypothetical protein OROHE_026275 [Orobanche hederae]